MEILEYIKQKIIIRAQKELAKKTDISFTFKEKKAGNKVAGVCFFIKRKSFDEAEEKAEAEIEDLAINDINLYLRLQDYFCLSPAQAKKVVKDYEQDPEKIKNNLNYAEKKIKAGEVQNIGAYTWKALEENWQEQLSLFETQEKALRKKQEDQERFKRFKEDLNQQYRQLCITKGNEYKITLSENEVIEIENKIKEQVNQQKGEKTPGLKVFQRIGIENYYAQKAGVKPFSDWANEQATNFKKVHKIE